MYYVYIVIAPSEAAKNAITITTSTTTNTIPSIRNFFAFTGSSSFVTAHAIRPPMIPKRIGRRYHMELTTFFGVVASDIMEFHISHYINITNYIKRKMRIEPLTKVLDFVSVVSHQGRMRVIVIPKRMHQKLEKIEGKQVRITVDDILD